MNDRHDVPRAPDKLMRVLVLDDEDTRVDCFRAALPQALVEHVHSAEACVRHLADNRPDIVFLDHDLGLSEAYYGCWNPGCGQDVTRWIARNGSAKWAESLFVVHSLNPTGAMGMMMDLVSAGLKASRRAYAWMDKQDLSTLQDLWYWPTLLERWDVSWPVTACEHRRSVPIVRSAAQLGWPENG